MRKMAIITAGLLIGASLLAGCGSDDKDSKASGKDYCALLKSSADEINAVAGSDVPDAKTFENFIKDAGDIADKAPSEVADDWKVVTGKLKELTDALDEAGIKIDDVASAAATGKLPEGVTMAEFQALAEKIQGLGTEEFDAATKAIDKNAKDDCKLDLSMAGTS